NRPAATLAAGGRRLCAGGPSGAVGRRFGARALGSVGDRRKLQKRAWSAAVRSAHDDGPAALCLLLWSLFLAEDSEGLRRAGRFHDDRGARRASWRSWG